jgi:hypothetical protein
MEIFGCLGKQGDVFLNNCAIAIWSLKGLEGPPFYVLLFLFNKKIQLQALQKLQAFSILSRMVAITLITSRLPPFLDTPPISTTDF